MKRVRWPHWVAAAAMTLALTLTLAACSPTAPSPPTVSAASIVVTPSTGPTVPAPGPSAEVEVVSFESGGTALADGRISYEPRLGLRESSGRSSARLTQLTFMPKGHDNESLGQECLKNEVVPAGKTWTLDHVYIYCRSFSGSAPIADMTVVIDFLDDAGVPSQILATAK